MQAQANSQPQQQLRGFVAVWIGITLLIGIATFVAIYVGTGSLDGSTTASARDNTTINTANNFENPIGGDDAALAVAPNNDNNANANAVADDNTSDNNMADDDMGNDTAENTVADDTQGEADANTITDTNNEADVLPQETEEADEGGEDAAPQATETPVPEPTVPAIQDREFDLGIQVAIDFNYDNNPGYLDAAANQMSLNWVKLQVRWEFIEPEQGVYDWALLDHFFSLTPDYDLKVMASVVTTPDWAREPGANLEQHGPPADYQQFANFVTQLITRYPGKIHAIEIWNEQNLAREWTSTRGISAADYLQMARAVATSVKFVDPNMILISGALAPTGVDNADATNDFTYTDQMIAGGILDIVDCFGAHHNGYNIGPRVAWDQVPPDPDAVFRGPFENPHPSWSFYSTLTTYANKIQAVGSDVPLCVTEFGWATSAGYDTAPQNFEYALDNTLEEHGDYIEDAVTLMSEEWDFVWLAFVWNLNFAPVQGFDPTNDNVPYSLIRPGYIPSPAWPRIANFNFRGQ